VGRLLRDEGLSWLDWRRLQARDEPEVLDALVAAAGADYYSATQARVVELLVAAADRPAGLAVLETPAQSTALLRAYCGAPIPEPTLQPAVDRAISVLLGFDRLVERLGALLVQEARRLADGPADVVWDILGNYASYLGSPRLACVRVLSSHGEPADVARLARIAHSVEEDPWYRVEAMVGWHRLAGAAALPAILEWFADPRPRTPSDFSPYASRLAHVGADLVPPMLERLRHADYTIRHRAVTLLAHIGPPAVAALTELVRETDDWRVLENAREALLSINPAALRRATRERETVDRGLSLVDDEPGAERGISRAEGGDGG
ncbi:MAG: HEAT repeat domain-containing protein, partial [Armatimonadetes bacterium]|nr:HEAT repeat domain-containing protein [Armatimonadota bacterium]